jgi:16S rRNA (cytidine1402-2'-O)-methyltransferase
MPTATIFLIPNVLYENELQTIPSYVLDAIKKCDVFFVETEKTTRRYFKLLWKEMVIDNYEWHTIHKAEKEVVSKFAAAIHQHKTIGIVSDAGCACIADPGQILVAKAQQLGAIVKPLVGPSSILLALMASGMSGQNFQFVGYIPIDSLERTKRLKELELYSSANKCTQMFIETPYRNNQLLKEILQLCKPNTQLCLAVDITSPHENINTKTVEDWKKNIPELHKKQVLFLIMGW